MLASLENVTKSFGDQTIFQGVSLKIEEGDRIGLIGVNGAGKSTLLEVLEGTQEFESGQRSIQNGLAIGFLRQNSGLMGENTIHQEMRSAFSALLEIKQKLKTLAAQLETLDKQSPQAMEITQEYARLQTYFEANEGYLIDIKINTVLHGMGFGSRDPSTPVKALSGGEKTRLALCRLLLQAPKLLILDEPTNHLDFASLDWLEEYLEGYKGAIVVVSHDRYFLDKLVTKIWELDRKEFFSYKGNYTKYTQLKEERYQRQLKEYEAQQVQIAALEDYIARNKVRATTAQMAKSREKELERLPRIAKPKPPVPPANIRFSFEKEPVKEVLHVTGLALSVGQGAEKRQLCSNLDFDLLRGQKVALVGANGVGKSTFLKTLMNLLSLEQGKIVWGKHVKVSYFEQEQTKLHPNKTVLQELWDRYPKAYEQEIRTALGGVRFSGDTIYKRVDALSGGEKARLKFAIMMLEKGNVLLLDEPTNHLDLATKDVLDRALMEYEGTILAVSHDRYLLSRMPTKIVEMTPEGFIWYDGGYEKYKNRQAAAIGAANAAKEPFADAQGAAAPAGTNEYYRSKKQRAQQVARKKRFVQVEEEISQLEEEISQKEGLLASPQVASDYEQVALLCQELESLRETLAQRMEEWEELGREQEETV